MTNISTALASGSFVNTGTITCTPGQNFDITQDVVLTQYSSLVVNTIMNTLSQNEEMAKLINEFKAMESSENKGVASVLTALGLFILLPLAILALIFFFMNQGKNMKAQKDLKQLAKFF